MPPGEETPAEVDLTSQLIDDDDRSSTLDAPSPVAGSAAGAAQAAPAAPGAADAPAAPAGTPAQPAAQPLSARDYAAQQFGYQQAGQYADDAAFLQALVAGQQSAAQYQRRVQELEAERMAWLTRAGQPAAPAAPESADPLAAFKGPAYDPRWLSMVKKDEQGNIVPLPGVDPTVVPKLMAALQHRQTIMEKFADNPMEFIQPLVQQQAKTLLEQHSQSMMGQFQERQQQEQFLSQNASWLFARDSAGNPVMNPQTGGYVPTREGLAFYNHVRRAESLGIKSAKAQEEFARALLLGDMAMPLLHQNKQGTDGAQARQQAIDTLNRRQPNQAGSVATGGHTGAAQNQNLPYSERLKMAFASEGINDADLAGEDR